VGVLETVGDTFVARMSVLVIEGQPLAGELLTLWLDRMSVVIPKEALTAGRMKRQRIQQKTRCPMRRAGFGIS
jgi:hypothetical protein